MSPLPFGVHRSSPHGRDYSSLCGNVRRLHCLSAFTVLLRLLGHAWTEWSSTKSPLPFGVHRSSPILTGQQLLEFCIAVSIAFRRSPFFSVDGGKPTFTHRDWKSPLPFGVHRSSPNRLGKLCFENRLGVSIAFRRSPFFSVERQT